MEDTLPDGRGSDGGQGLAGLCATSSPARDRGRVWSRPVAFLGLPRDPVGAVQRSPHAPLSTPSHVPLDCVPARHHPSHLVQAPLRADRRCLAARSVIADVLEERGWSQAEFAQRIDYTPKHVNQLLRGKWIHGGLLRAGAALL